MMMNPDCQYSPSDAEIAVRAYQIWEACGRPEGCSLEHWVQAKALLISEQMAMTIAPCGSAAIPTAKLVPAEKKKKKAAR